MVGYIVNSYCLRFNRGGMCVVVVGYIVNSYCLRMNRGVVCVLVVGYIVNCYCLRLNRGVVCCCDWLYCQQLLFYVQQRSGVLLWLVILLTVTV